jgi:ion channel-forming bestrophin family protein
LSLTARNLARVIWVHVPEREGELAKEDLLAKMYTMSLRESNSQEAYPYPCRTTINLILAFAVALKHRLRFEPYMHYDDLQSLVVHLNTFAKAATYDEVVKPIEKTAWKAAGEYLGIPFATSNPRKLLKRSKKPTGNLPLEILTHLSAYTESVLANGTLKLPIMQTQISKSHTYDVLSLQYQPSSGRIHSRTPNYSFQ